jgi:uncharacterized membrane-anchored protein
MDQNNRQAKEMLSKVPEVTLYFWIIKVLCTTVGETASDYLNVNLNLGLIGTSLFMGALLLIALFIQFRSKNYNPKIYWPVVVLISIFGTLLTDILTDKIGVPLISSTVGFSLLLALTFLFWYIKEKTLSIHSIFTKKRELFYWLTILFTFALGTASGDLMAEGLGLGYLTTGIIVCSVILLVSIAWFFKLNDVISFWIIYILTRPLGASIGDYLTQSPKNGGLGLGASLTSALFLAAILVTVAFLVITKKDLIQRPKEEKNDDKKGLNVMVQLVLVLIVLITTAGSAYYLYSQKLQKEITTLSMQSTHEAPLGNLSVFRIITEETLKLVQAGDLISAQTRITDLESEWDKAATHLRAMNPQAWKELDESIDSALRALRAVKQDANNCATSLRSLIITINKMDKPK